MRSEHGITGVQDRTILVRYLNDLGVAIHFDAFRVKNVFVLEPRQAATGVYRIIPTAGRTRRWPIRRCSDDSSMPTDPTRVGIPTVRWPHNPYRRLPITGSLAPQTQPSSADNGWVAPT